MLAKHWPTLTFKFIENIFVIVSTLFGRNLDFYLKYPVEKDVFLQYPLHIFRPAKVSHEENQVNHPASFQPYNILHGSTVLHNKVSVTEMLSQCMKRSSILELDLFLYDILIYFSVKLYRATSRCLTRLTIVTIKLVEFELNLV